MTREEINILHKEKIRTLLKIGTAKGFDKEEIIKPACIIAGSEQMHQSYGDTLKAMDKVIELCKQIDDENDFLQAVLSLAGIE